ncbi:MAG: cytidylyltransferase domain-containing protein [Halanaerobiales bacterium]
MAKVAVIVQARMGSERLPGKVALQVKGKPLLAHLIDRLKQAEKIDQIIIATSDKEADDPVAEIADACGVSSYRGSETDVLSRYLEAAEKYAVDIIIRVTGDCPLIDPVTIDELAGKYLDSDLDYMRLNVEEDGYPRGLDAEIFSFETLKRAAEYIEREGEPEYSPYREHVTLYIYRHPEFFKTAQVDPPVYLRRDYRLCVDEKEDFELIKEIYRRFYNENEIIDIRDVIRALDEDPVLAGMNKNVQQKRV